MSEESQDQTVEQVADHDPESAMWADRQATRDGAHSVEIRTVLALELIADELTRIRLAGQQK